jgi:hypothetical protein
LKLFVLESRSCTDGYRDEAGEIGSFRLDLSTLVLQFMQARSPRALLVLPLLGACAAPPTLAPSWQSIELSAGPHGMDEQSWDPLDARVLGALTFSGRKPEWPCGFEFGMQYARAESKDESVASGADFIDFRLGAAWEWLAFDWLRLVCGGGPRLGLVNVTRPGNFAEVTEEGTSLGFYAHAGVFVKVYGSFSVGLEGQWADGSDYDVGGESHDASATELLVALRWEF